MQKIRPLKKAKGVKVTQKGQQKICIKTAGRIPNRFEVENWLTSLACCTSYYITLNILKQQQENEHKKLTEKNLMKNLINNSLQVAAANNYWQKTTPHG